MSNIAAYSMAMPIVRERREWLFTLLVAATFYCGLATVIGPKIGLPGILANGITALFPVALLVYSYTREPKFRLSSLRQGVRFGLVSIAAVATGMCFIVYSNQHLYTEVYAATLKTIGVIIIIVSLPVAVRVLNERELRNGIALFALLELMTTIMMFATNFDANKNMIAARFAVSALILWGLKTNVVWRVTSGGFFIILAIAMQCRTAVLAMLMAAGVLYILTVFRHDRNAPIVILFAIAVGSVIILPYAVDVGIDALVYYSGKDNFLSRSLLSDKSEDAIRSNFLDRKQVWEYSWQYIKERPLIGYGLGTEQEVMGVRCHNAFLSLMFEGGVFYMLAWLSLYLSMLLWIFTSKGANRNIKDPMLQVYALICVYLIAAGNVESSGLGSVSTPGNLILIALTVYFAQPKFR